jgi:ribonuclease BN (tRNA processing enzyme)
VRPSLGSGAVRGRNMANSTSKPDKVEILFVGTGAAFGPPDLYCPCRVCTSSDPKDKRAESGLLIKAGKTRMMFDAGRGTYGSLMEHEYNSLQAIGFPIDAVAVTHMHFDHWGGVEELAQAYRRYQRREGVKPEDILPLKVFTHKVTWREGIGKTWGFLTRPSRAGTRPPVLEHVDCQGQEHYANGSISFKPYPVRHGPKGKVEGCLAFLVTIDCLNGTRKILITGDLSPIRTKTRDDPTWTWENWQRALPFDKQDELDLVVTEANSWGPCPKAGHQSAMGALDMLEQWQPKQAVLTHISHEHKMTHVQIEQKLAEELSNRARLSQVEVEVCYDGMSLSLGD